MTSFHISPKTNEPANCSATPETCPFGGEHFDRMSDAWRHVENSNEGEFGTFSTVNKSSGFTTAELSGLERLANKTRKQNDDRTKLKEHIESLGDEIRRLNSKLSSNDEINDAITQEKLNVLVGTKNGLELLRDLTARFDAAEEPAIAKEFKLRNGPSNSDPYSKEFQVWQATVNSIVQESSDPDSVSHSMYEAYLPKSKPVKLRFDEAYRKSRMKKPSPWLFKWKPDDVVENLGISEKQFKEEAQKFAVGLGQSPASFRARWGSWNTGGSSNMPLNVQAYLESNWNDQIQERFVESGVTWKKSDQDGFPRQSRLDRVKEQIEEVRDFFKDDRSPAFYDLMNRLNREKNDLERDLKEWERLSRAS